MFQLIKYDKELETSVIKCIDRLKCESEACQKYGEALNASNRNATPAGRTYVKAKAPKPETGTGDDGKGTENNKKPLCLWKPNNEKGLAITCATVRIVRRMRKRTYWKHFVTRRRESKLLLVVKSVPK